MHVCLDLNFYLLEHSSQRFKPPARANMFERFHDLVVLTVLLVSKLVARETENCQGFRELARRMRPNIVWQRILSPSHTIHSSAWSPWWSCLTGWQCSGQAPPCPWTPPWRRPCHPPARQPQIGGSPTYLRCEHSALTCLQSLSLKQEQREAFQIRVYDTGCEGALGAIKSLIVCGDNGWVEEAKRIKTVTGAFSPPLTERLSPVFNHASPFAILWLPTSTIIAHPPTSSCRLMVLWLVRVWALSTLCVKSTNGRGNIRGIPSHIVVPFDKHLWAEWNWCGRHLPNVNTRLTLKNADVNESKMINLFNQGYTNVINVHSRSKKHILNNQCQWAVGSIFPLLTRPCDTEQKHTTRPKK